MKAKLYNYKELEQATIEQVFYKYRPVDQHGKEILSLSTFRRRVLRTDGSEKEISEAFRADNLVGSWTKDPMMRGLANSSDFNKLNQMWA